MQSREEWTEKSLGAKGFTLIELLVVIIILGILAAVAIFAVGNISDNAKKEACKTEISTVETAITAYDAQYSVQPADETALLSSSSPKGNLKKKPKYVTVTAGVMSPIGTLPQGCSIT